MFALRLAGILVRDPVRLCGRAGGVRYTERRSFGNAAATRGCDNQVRLSGFGVFVRRTPERFMRLDSRYVLVHTDRF